MTAQDIPEIPPTKVYDGALQEPKKVSLTISGRQIVGCGGNFNETELNATFTPNPK